METIALSARPEPQQAVIGWLIFFFLLFIVFAIVVGWIEEAFRPPPPPPFVAPPIRIPEETASGNWGSIESNEELECRRRSEQLAAERPAGWSYRAALALLEPPLALLRERFNRLLLKTYSQVSPQRLEWSQYIEYRTQRHEELRQKLAELSEHFTRRLGPACEREDLNAITHATSQIVWDCTWIFGWAADQYQYQEKGDYVPARPVRARTAEHIIRQVEVLVTDLRRAVNAPQFAGPLLFRAEFYIPEDSEVDKPVLAVIEPPKGAPRLHESLALHPLDRLKQSLLRAVAQAGSPLHFE